VPISFVADQLETLGEIDHEAREEAKKIGIERFEMSGGLNDSPTFVSALAELVAETIDVDSSKQRRSGYVAAN